MCRSSKGFFIFIQIEITWLHVNNLNYRLNYNWTKKKLKKGLTIKRCLEKCSFFMYFIVIIISVTNITFLKLSSFCILKLKQLSWFQSIFFCLYTKLSFFYLTILNVIIRWFGQSQNENIFTGDVNPTLHVCNLVCKITKEQGRAFKGKKGSRDVEIDHCNLINPKKGRARHIP